MLWNYRAPDSGGRTAPLMQLLATSTLERADLKRERVLQCTREPSSVIASMRLWRATGLMRTPLKPDWI
jgi:hypothetical protein